MQTLLFPPSTPAQQARDALLGALIGLARATTSEPKTADTDDVLCAGLLLAARPDAEEAALHRMLDIVHTEKHRVAPNCATCAMPCGNTADYDLSRLWTAAEPVRSCKLQLLQNLFLLAGQRPHSPDAVFALYQSLFSLAEDWDEMQLAPVLQNLTRQLS